MYNPKIGRFMQTDPIGYGAGINLYAYVSGDPVNLIDPLGLREGVKRIEPPDAIVIYANDIVVTGERSCGTYCASFSNVQSINDVRDQLAAFEASRSENRNEEVVVTTTCNAVCRANLREQERTKWVLWGDRFMLNPYYNNPAPWLTLPNVIAASAAVGAVGATAPVVAGGISVQGAAKGYQLYGVGRVWQVRFGTDKLIVRLDANKPITHLNIEGRLFGRSFNRHIPGW